MRWSRSLLVSSVLSLFVAACGGSKSGGGKQDGGNGLPDGFLSDGCANAPDCDDGDPCTEDRCVNKKCTYRGVDCSEMTDGCNVGVCDPTDGSCGTEPANDDSVCQTVDGDPGTCTSGFCQAAPQCYVDGYFSCGYTTSDDNSTTGTSIIDDYQCVQGLTGPEYAYDFYASSNKRVRVTLTSTADLDLVVLKGTKCAGAVECVASATTAGSGNETLEFDAKSGDDYVIVVDGRNGAKGSYSIAIECEGCKPKQTLTCNQTVMGDTTSATATTTVGGLYCMEGPGGPEEVYNVAVPVGTRMKVTLSGASTEHDLIAFEDEGGKCGDPYCTEYSVNDNPGNDVVTLETSEYADSDKWSVVVDAREAGGTYMLQVDCPVICATGGGTLTCGSGKITKRSDSAGSTSVVDAYSCAGATGYTGAEMIYEFSPSISGSYTIDLTDLDADLDLLVIEGDGYYYDAVCDPTALCKTSSVHTGTTAESVTFDADSLKNYYIIIDGKAGAAGNYSLKLNSTQCPAPSCYTSSNKLDCSWRLDARASNDPDRSKNLIDTWACGTEMTGSEVIYQLPIDKSGTYEVALTDAPTGINMFVIKGTSSTCSTSTTCETVVNKKATLNAAVGDYYYIVIDGKNGLNANYKVTLTSTACGVPTCKDPNHDLNCTTAKSYAGRSDAVGATRNVNQWTCSTSDKYTPAEYAHGFAPPKTGLYTVKLTNLSADLDLMVIEVDSWGCLPAANCAVTSMGGSTKAISALRGTADETVTFYGKSDKKYYFVIDGYAPNGEEVVSDYVIFLSSCAP